MQLFEIQNDIEILVFSEKKLVFQLNICECGPIGYYFGSLQTFE
jgi:hypothetical protein